MIAVLVVIVLFVKVLEQFGLLESGYNGKNKAPANCFYFFPYSCIVCKSLEVQFVREETGG